MKLTATEPATDNSKGRRGSARPLSDHQEQGYCLGSVQEPLSVASVVPQCQLARDTTILKRDELLPRDQLREEKEPVLLLDRMIAFTLPAQRGIEDTKDAASHRHPPLSIPQQSRASLSAANLSSSSPPTFISSVFAYPRIAVAASAVGLLHPEPRHELPPPPRPPPHSSSSSPSKRLRALSASLSLLAELIDGH
ncbi:uncharacterized protein CLUP02_15975 [Colletotrichum lupini]|uniref:Uncharacterized protein n=1 Tax=Colletotrichum lupini TaxID=145971 RepID=A0A9Q8T7X0_9PEZI|nr:uncharacterized protein CLUP02_15975 [Colletotrichum lupini]UQC90445.1 hypothetical protein CLUP02_15975 [Colletotrichum lupini]